MRKDLTISNEILRQADLGDEITIQTLSSVIVMKNKKMTILEVVQAIESLEGVVNDLFASLLDNFTNENCSNVCNFYRDYLDDNIQVPEWARRVCGIDLDSKLCIRAEEGSGRILLEPVNYENDITDIDEAMLAALDDMGVCLAALNEGIVNEEVI